MEKIEFSTDVKFGDATIESIEVAPLTFAELAKLWRRVSAMPGDAAINLQRERIRHQAHFTGGGKRVVPDIADLLKLPVAVAKAIIDNLDTGAGPAGEVLNEGNGITGALLYKLGTPIEMKDGKGESRDIIELEFLAETYGDVENILAAENEVQRTMALLAIAAPVGHDKLTRLPGWAIDRITTGDGITLMRTVLPNF